MPSKKTTDAAWLVGSVVLFLLPLVAAQFGAFTKTGKAFFWITGVVVFTASVFMAGGRKVLQDGNGRYSLANLQVLMWSMVLIPAIGCTGISNVFPGAFGPKFSPPNGTGPLDFTIPAGLWLLMGLQVGTAVAEEFQNKKDGKGDAAPQQFIAFEKPDEEFESNSDLLKAQGLFLTLTVIALYSAILWDTFTNKKFIGTLPDVPEGLIPVLIASHGGYLAANQNNKNP